VLSGLTELAAGALTGGLTRWPSPTPSGPAGSASAAPTAAPMALDLIALAPVRCSWGRPSRPAASRRLAAGRRVLDQRLRLRIARVSTAGRAAPRLSRGSRRLLHGRELGLHVPRGFGHPAPAARAEPGAFARVPLALSPSALGRQSSTGLSWTSRQPGPAHTPRAERPGPFPPKRSSSRLRSRPRRGVRDRAGAPAPPLRCGGGR
jgi:hypothetical protein